LLCGGDTFLPATENAPSGSWGKRLRDVQITYSDCAENRAGYSDITKQQGAGRESGKSIRIRTKKSARRASLEADNLQRSKGLAERL
jgi:hypothetical protein